jgi:hypothetical protein
MVRWMRTARIASGKYVEALQFARDIVEYTKKYEGVADIGVYLDSFGEVGTIRWMADYNDLASFEQVANQIYADPKWFQKMQAIEDLFLPGSVHDTVMRSY